MWLIFSIALIAIYIIFKNKIDALTNEVTQLQNALHRVQQQIASLNQILSEKQTSQKNSAQDETSLNPITAETIAKLVASQKPSSFPQNQDSASTLNTSLINTDQSDLDPNLEDTLLKNRYSEGMDLEGLNAEDVDLEDLYIDESQFEDIAQSSDDPSFANAKTPSTVADSSIAIPSEASSTIMATLPAEQTSSEQIATQLKHNQLAEPDEQTLPVVTSLLRSLKSWFLGGNLVVRVGAIVLLIGVVLLLRLISEYIETPISVKLMVIGVIGLAVAGLGLKLVKKRFTYGITLQGAGLSTAYLTAFFAYQVYHVIPSLPSFVLLGLLSVVTVVLAVRQNAFPLALLAFSGAFLAPILTSDDTGSLTTLFSYYLLLNVAIAVIAHYRTWKVLNLLGATVTFGLAYYWGFADTLQNNFATFMAQRWSLVLITSLHWLLYLFIAIRYAQQIIAYNRTLTNTDDITDKHTNVTKDAARQPINQPSLTQPLQQALLFPIDTGLMFATPLLVFGLLSTLLHDIDHALTVVSAVMSATYLGLGWMLAQRSRHYALLTEGMLALGFGFLALIIPLEFDAQWVAFGWSVQGLALVWFGRRSLRAWSVLFGLLLQTLAIMSLFEDISFTSHNVSYLALSVSALCWMITMFVLRHSNSPIGSPLESDQRLLSYVNSNTVVFNIIWQSAPFIYILTLAGMIWTLLVTILNLENWFDFNHFLDTGIVATVFLSNLIIYWAINRYRHWHEVSLFTHGLLGLFYLALLLILPELYETYNSGSQGWLPYTFVFLGGLVMGQLWIKSWVTDYQATHLNSEEVSKHAPMIDDIQPTLWLATGITLIAQFAHYLLPDSDDTVTVIIVSSCLIALVTLAKRKLPDLTPWFNWHHALIGCRYLFMPLLFGWVVITNGYHDGVIWHLPYIPVLNLYDIASLLALGYGLNIYYLINKTAQDSVDSNSSKATVLFHTLVILSIWVFSSVLVRTLHAYAGTPLWIDGASGSDKVQISLTIFWTLTAFFIQYKGAKWLPKWLTRQHWQKAFIGYGYVFILLLLSWVVVSNWYQDGMIWDLPYIPVLNLYDIALLLTLAYGVNLHYLTADKMNPLAANYLGKRSNILLKIIGIAGFWVLSSMLVRTLHAYADTPLWVDGAWNSDKVQTSLTILWTLIALIATFMSSRNGKRFWWFMGISLLGMVVLKLVLVDLSQTEAIWRVVSFIGAGSLILLIGYLAPLPPEDKASNDEQPIDGI